MCCLLVKQKSLIHKTDCFIMTMTIVQWKTRKELRGYLYNYSSITTENVLKKHGCKFQPFWRFSYWATVVCFTWCQCFCREKTNMMILPQIKSASNPVLFMRCYNKQATVSCCHPFHFMHYTRSDLSFFSTSAAKNMIDN